MDKFYSQSTVSERYIRESSKNSLSYKFFCVVFYCVVITSAGLMFAVTVYGIQLLNWGA